MQELHDKLKLLMVEKVLFSFLDQFRAVLKSRYSRVTGIAEQCAHGTRLMIMVNIQWALVWAWDYLADRASIILNLKHLVELFWAYPVSPLSMGNAVAFSELRIGLFPALSVAPSAFTNTGFQANSTDRSHSVDHSWSVIKLLCVSHLVTLLASFLFQHSARAFKFSRRFQSAALFSCSVSDSFDRICNGQGVNLRDRFINWLGSSGDNPLGHFVF